MLGLKYLISQSVLSFDHLLPMHYENTPIQIYRKFHLKKTENFQIKKALTFFIFLLKT